MSVTTVRWVVKWWYDRGNGEARPRTREFVFEDEARSLYDALPGRDRLLFRPGRITRRQLIRVESTITYSTIEDEPITGDTI